MSLISDLLSKVKQTETKKEVPPGLKNKVKASREKSSHKRLLVILTAIIVVSFGSGIATLYLVPHFLHGSRSNLLVAKDNVRPEKRVVKNSKRRSSPKKKNGEAGKIPPSKAKGKQKTDLKNKPDTSDKGIDNSKKDKRPPEIKLAAKTTDRVQGNQKPLGAEPPVKKVAQQPEKKEVAIKKAVEIEAPPAKSKSPNETTPDEESPIDTKEKASYIYEARSYERNHNYPKALASYKNALDVDYKDYKIMNQIASIYLRINLVKEAEGYLEDALLINEDYVPALINAGIVYASEKRFSDAELHLSRALSLEPVNRSAMFNLALLHEKQGKYANALKYYSRMKKLGDARGDKGISRVKHLTR